jgi:hypothetical protein
LRSEEVENALEGLVYVSGVIADHGFSNRTIEPAWVLDARERPETEPEPMEAENVEPPLPPPPPPKGPRPRWRFPLICGMPQEDFPEFVDFRRENWDNWESIEILMERLYKICEDKCLKKQWVDGVAIAEVCKVDPDEVSREKLIRCFLDRSISLAPRRAMGFGFVGPEAENKAAILIQAVWRGFQGRRCVRQLRRQGVAAKMLQRWYSKRRRRAQLKELVKVQVQARLEFHEKMQGEPRTFSAEAIAIVHCVEGYSGLESARFLLQKRTGSLFIMYSRVPFPHTIREECGGRVLFFGPRFKYSLRGTIQDLLAGDWRTQREILEAAGDRQIVLQPSEACESVVEASHRLNAFALMPMRAHLLELADRAALMDLLAKAGIEVFHRSELAYDQGSLCRVIAALSFELPYVGQWRIRSKGEMVGWINVCEISMQNPVKEQEDGALGGEGQGKSSKAMGIAQTVSGWTFHGEMSARGTASGKDVREQVADFEIVAHPFRKMSKEAFLHYLWVTGVSLEETPFTVRSTPHVAFEVNSEKTMQIVGTWDDLYWTAFDPFAQIHPAFTVPAADLKEKTMMVTSGFTERPLVGTNVIDFWASPGAEGLKYVVDDVRVGDYTSYLGQLAAEQASNTQFDPETMSLGPSTFVYIQETLELPKKLRIDEVEVGLRQRGFQVGSRVFLLPSLRTPAVVSLVVVGESPKELIDFVYRLMLTLGDEIFDALWNQDQPIWRYCYAIDSLVKQFEAGDIDSTVITTRVRPRDVIMYNNDRLSKEVTMEPEPELAGDSVIKIEPLIPTLSEGKSPMLTTMDLDSLIAGSGS